MKALGSPFRIALTVLAVGGLVAVAAIVPTAIAAEEYPQLERLWTEFPLDDRGAVADRARPVRDRPAGDQASTRGAEVTTRPRSQPTVKPSPAGQASDRSPVLAILVAALTVLVGVMALLLFRAGPRRRQAETIEPALDQSGDHRAPAATAEPSSDQNRVVGALVAGLAEAPRSRKSKEVKMRTTAQGRQRSDPLVLKDGASGSSGAKAEEVEALKRKLVEEAELLKAKASRDPSLLKEKLVSGQRSAQKVQKVKRATQSSKAAEHPAQGRGGELATRRSLRHIRPAELREPEPTEHEGNGYATAVECEVRWWRGYVNSQFFAVQRDPNGAELTLAASPPFRWRKSEPPPQTPATSSALASLVDSFRRDGWVVAGHGSEWFAVRLRRAKLHSGGPSTERFPIHANGGR